jgi:two-component system sensor histidine kinase PilS (NtrC family)
MDSTFDLPPPSEGLKQRLLWLVVQRLGGAALLLLSVYWTQGWRSAMGLGAWRIFLCVGALSLIYALALEFGTRHELQARLQIVGDLALTSALVWVTLLWDGRNVHSPYILLYIIVISIASIFLGPREAIYTAVGAAFLLTAIMLGVLLEWWSQYVPLIEPAQHPKLMTVVGLYNIGFLVVGLLAAHLAARQTRSQERLKAATQSLANLRALHERIVESIDSGVVTTDLEGRIYTFNLAAQAITGHKTADVRGQEIYKLFGPEGSRIAEAIGKVRQDQHAPLIETECPTADGGRVFLAINVVPLAAEDGEVTGLVLTLQDLTGLRHLEETSRRQDRLAAVGRMAAAIAHEMRNPLAAMRGSIQMLEQTSADPTQEALMEIVLRESDRINRIVTDYLTYASPRANAPVSVDLCEVLEAALTEARATPEMHENHVIETSWPQFPMLLKADEGQLRQAFGNIARNALQAMPAGGTLRVEVQTPNPFRRRVIFQDTGLGMSPEQVERLFEPFNSNNGGVGLGLPIVYQIVREHGGTINVRSQLQQGTTITVELPLEN